jgi:hypothetical protein
MILLLFCLNISLRTLNLCFSVKMPSFALIQEQIVSIYGHVYKYKTLFFFRIKKYFIQVSHFNGNMCVISISFGLAKTNYMSSFYHQPSTSGKHQ